MKRKYPETHRTARYNSGDIEILVLTRGEGFVNSPYNMSFDVRFWPAALYFWSLTLSILGWTGLTSKSRYNGKKCLALGMKIPLIHSSFSMQNKTLRIDWVGIPPKR